MGKKQKILIITSSSLIIFGILLLICLILLRPAVINILLSAIFLAVPVGMLIICLNQNQEPGWLDSLPTNFDILRIPMIVSLVGAIVAIFFLWRNNWGLPISEFIARHKVLSSLILFVGSLSLAYIVCSRIEEDLLIREYMKQIKEDDTNKYTIDYDFGIISEQDIQQLFKDDTGIIEIVFTRTCQNKEKKMKWNDSVKQTDEYLYVDLNYCITITSKMYSIQKPLFSVKWRASGTFGRMAGEPLIGIDNEKAVTGFNRYISPLLDFLKNKDQGEFGYNIEEFFSFFVAEKRSFSYSDFDFIGDKKIIEPRDRRTITITYKTKKQILDSEKKKFEEDENRKKVYLPPYDWISFQFIIDNKWKSYLIILNSNGITCRYPIMEKNMSNGGIDRYQKAIVTDGKIALVKLLSSLPAPETIKRELLKKDTIDHIVQCLVKKQDKEFTFHNGT